MENGLIHKDLTDKIIGTFYEVYNELGFGFLESVYEDAMVIALEEKGLEVGQQIAVPVWFRGRSIGKFAADLLIEHRVIVELKAVSKLVEVHAAQLMHYLRATEVEVGLVMNFGPRPEFKRRVFENTRKTMPTEPTVLLKNLLS